MKPLANTRPLDRLVELLHDSLALAAGLRRRDALAELEADEARESAEDSRRPGVYHPGDRVVYSARWLQLVYAQRAGFGPDALVREWTIRRCRCVLCREERFVCTTERLSSGHYQHLARGIVRHAGLVQVDDLQVLTLKKHRRRRRPA